MRYFLLIPSLLASPALADGLPCEDKVLVLEEQGIPRAALQKALAVATDPAKPSPRYVLMARTEGDGRGILFLVDTHTGRVEEYLIGHGLTEESRVVKDGVRPWRSITPYGGLMLKPDPSEKFLMTGTAWSEEMKTALSKDEDQISVRLAGDLENCGGAYGNDLCMKKDEFTLLRKVLLAERKRNPDATIPLFVYPRSKKHAYWKQPPTGSPDQMCKALDSMKTPSPAGGTGSSGNTPSSGDGQQ